MKVKKGKGEEEEKFKKAIMDILLAVIMLASVFVAAVPTSEARTTANEIDAGDTVYIGEQSLKFDTDGDGVYGGATDLDFVLEGVPDTPTEGKILTVDAQGWTVPSVTRGKYIVAGIPADDAGLEPSDGIYVDAAEITGDIILNTATQDSVVGKSVSTSSEIVFKVVTNFGGRIPGACVDIKLTDPDGVEICVLDEVALRDILLLGTIMYVGNSTPTTTAPPYFDAIDLTDLDIGPYKVKIKTDKATCNMLDISSPEYTFTVREEELSIEAEKEVVCRGEDILLIIMGNPKTYYYLTVTGVDVSAPPAIKMAGDVVALDTAGDAYPATKTSNLAAWLRTRIDGIAKVRVSTTGADERTYTMKVYDTTPFIADRFTPDYPDFVPDSKVVSIKYDKVDVKVVKPAVTFDIPASVAIGEKVTIKGTVSAGDRVDILIDDGDVVYFDDEPVDEDKEFEVKWDTAGLTVGFYWIDAYIDCPYDSYDEIETAGIDEDGSTVIWLAAPALAAKQPRNVVAEGDDYTIKGTATGVDDVDIVLVGPKGYPAADPGLSVLNGLEIVSSSVSVTDDEFSEDVEMTEGLDLGMWVTLVLAPGIDGTYGDLSIGAGELAEIPTVVFAGKTQAQIVEMLKDHTIDVAGSDDLLVSFTFEVETPYVRFEPIESVTIGEPLEIAGTTNREPGTVIAIWTIEGPAKLPTVITMVEWPTADQGVFTATIDTSDAVPGTYTLKAEDADGNTDTATIEILPPKLPTPEVSVFTDKKEYSPGDTMKTSIRLSNPTDDTQTLSFKWYIGIPEYDLWAEITTVHVNLLAGYDQTFTVSIPVGDWGKESFCGCHIVSLTDTKTKKVVSVDSTAWIYTPGAVSKSKTSAQIAKEITKGIVGVELPG